MNIHKFKQYIVESKLDIESEIKIEINDKWGNHTLTCKLVEFLLGINRSKLGYRFRVIKTDTNHYPVGAEMIFPMNFDNTNFDFLIYPYYNEKPGTRSMTELSHHAECKII